jgi:hypothetical protein
MQHYLKTVESALATIQELPEGAQEATIYVSHGATLRGKLANPDVIESLLADAMFSSRLLLPAGSTTNEHGKMYRYASRQPKRPDAAEPSDA